MAVFQKLIDIMAAGGFRLDVLLTAFVLIVVLIAALAKQMRNHQSGHQNEASGTVELFSLPESHKDDNGRKESEGKCAERSKEIAALPPDHTPSSPGGKHLLCTLLEMCPESSPSHGNKALGTDLTLKTERVPYYSLLDNFDPMVPLSPKKSNRAARLRSLLFDDMAPLENISPNVINNNADHDKLLKERVIFLENQVKTLQTILKAQNSKLSDHDKKIQILYALMGGRSFETFSITSSLKHVAGDQAHQNTRAPSIDAMLFDNWDAPSTSNSGLFNFEKGLELFDKISTPVLQPLRRMTDPVKKEKQETAEKAAAPAAPSPPKIAEPVPWDGSINWKMSRLFDSHADEIEALSTPGIVFDKPPRSSHVRDANNQVYGIHDLPMYDTGLRYLPNSRETNYLRSVRIGALPNGVKLNEVLAQVCGGIIFSAQLLNTLPMNGYHTALIIFVQQSAAEAFVAYANETGIWIKGMRAVVKMVNTPTYPLSNKYESLLRQGYSRCLAIENAKPDMLDKLRELLYDCLACRDFIEACEEDFKESSGTIQIRFHGLKNSVVAHGFLTKHPAFKGCRFRFATDPCARMPPP